MWEFVNVLPIRCLKSVLINHLRNPPYIAEVSENFFWLRCITKLKFDVPFCVMTKLLFLRKLPLQILLKITSICTRGIMGGLIPSPPRPSVAVATATHLQKHHHGHRLWNVGTFLKLLHRSEKVIAKEQNCSPGQTCMDPFWV